MVVPPDYLTREQTCAMLEIAAKTLEKWVTHDRIKSTTVPRPGRMPERVYERQDVLRILHEMKQRALRNPNQPASGPRPALGSNFTFAPETMDFLREIFARNEQEQKGLPEPEPPPKKRRRRVLPPHVKVWLTLHEAGDYLGLPLKLIRVLQLAGYVASVRCGRRTFIGRESLRLLSVDIIQTFALQTFKEGKKPVE
jgi:hypothetical protein